MRINSTATDSSEQIARELAAERERLRITLASIGDGVISVDVAGNVVYLNGVAEVLTGWSEDNARGKSIKEIFVIINDTTRNPVTNPVLQALEEARIVELANHTLLIARDGVERPIDDSAAPMLDADGGVIGAVLVFRDVTERKRAEETRVRLAAIVESSDDAILSKTLDGIIRSWNSGAKRLFGYTSDEAIGKSITIIIPPDLIDEERAIIERLRRGERIEHYDTVRVGKDGRLLDISLTVSPIMNKEGRVIGASKIARDITDRKRSELALRESEGRHRFLSDLAAATQILVDPKEVMTETARRVLEHLQVQRCAYAEVEAGDFVITGDYTDGIASMVGRVPIAAFGPEVERAMYANEPFVINDVDTDRRAGVDLAAYRQARIQAAICVPLHRGGKLSAAMAVHRTSPRVWTPSEVELMRTLIGRCSESIARIGATRGMQEAADRLTLALDAARLGNWSWDATTDIVDLSERAREIFELGSDTEMTRTNLINLVHEDDRPKIREAIQRSVVSGNVYDVEYRLSHPKRRGVWISSKGRTQLDPITGLLGMYGVVQDITERKTLENELLRRAEELAESDRKKDDFIALLAHELRNPLAPVRTGLQVMRLAEGDRDAFLKARTMMDRQLSHMVRLIDDLLDVSRINRSKLHLQPSHVLLSEIVSHAVETAGPLIEASGHTLEVNLPASPIVLNADLTRLAQVFGNLLTNAAKYTKSGGRIWLSAAVFGDEVVVSVRDTGLGISSESLPHIFEMFSQIDTSRERSSGGLGIGLALVKGLVEMHGGRVEAESEGPGSGSTFRVYLPIAPEYTDASRPALADLPISHKHISRRVLVVDDNYDGADSIAAMLKLLGHKVQVAHDGAAAVELAEQLRPELILMDIGMPKLNGLEATALIRAKPWAKDIVIVALTGWGQESDREQSRAAGCNEHLVKPVSLDDLTRVINDFDPKS